MSHFINARATGYQDLPNFPENAPDPSVRNVELPPMWTEPPKSSKLLGTKSKKPQKSKSFYSDDDENSESSDEESDSDSEDSSSGSEDEDSSSSEESSESSDEEDFLGVKPSSETRGSKKDQKRNSEETSAKKKRKDKDSTDESSSSEDDDDSSESSSSYGSSSESSDESSSEESETDKKKSKKSVEKAKAKSEKSKSAERSNLDLLLELDDVPPSMDTPILTPSLGGLLTPTISADDSLGLDASKLSPGASIKPGQAMFVPTEGQELLNRLSGGGLSISARFTRSPHLYSPKMTSIELTFHNHGSENVKDISMGQKKLAPGISIHDFAGINSVAPDSKIHGTLGVDFNDTTMTATFDVSVGGSSYTLNLNPTVGEIIQPMSMNLNDFDLSQVSFYENFYFFNSNLFCDEYVFWVIVYTLNYMFFSE